MIRRLEDSDPRIARMPLEDYVMAGESCFGEYAADGEYFLIRKVRGTISVYEGSADEVYEEFIKVGQEYDRINAMKNAIWAWKSLPRGGS